MGLDVSGKIIVGEVLKEVESQEKVIRYNEVTGKPFETLKTVKKWHFSDGTVYKCDEDKEDDLFCNYGEDHAVLGFELSATDLRNCKHFLEIDEVLISILKNKYQEQYNRKAKLINFLSYG